MYTFIPPQPRPMIDYSSSKKKKKSTVDFDVDKDTQKSLDEYADRQKRRKDYFDAMDAQRKKLNASLGMLGAKSLGFKVKK